MKKVNYSILFISWLAKKRKFNHYYQNYSNQHSKKENYFSLYLNRYNTKKAIVNILASAFDWDNTKEGFEYWNKLNDEWNEYLEKNDNLIK